MTTLLPPPQYDVPPPVPVIEHVLSLDEVYRICGSHAFLGCSIFSTGGKECRVYLVRAGAFVLTYDHTWITAAGPFTSPAGRRGFVTPDRLAATRRHERAHCAGWPGDHPGGVWVPDAKVWE